MELTQQSPLEELTVIPKTDNWTSFPNEFFPNSWSFTPFDQATTSDSHFPLPDPSFSEVISPMESVNGSSIHSPYLQPFLDTLTLSEFGSFCDVDDLMPAAAPVVEADQYVTKLENTELGFLDDAVNCFLIRESDVLVDAADNNVDIIFNNNNNNSVDNSNSNNNAGFCGEKKSKLKKANGQPSKNLMAERRRRKRLNDRLSMLRAIVPKISKMDRTSILSDTIDYMKELLDKIQKLREEDDDENVQEFSLIGNYSKELKPNEMLVRTPPKFDVERRDDETRVEISCTSKPGLLISALSTLDALGLDIRQCVISCFNDFTLRATCYEAAEHRTTVNSEDVRQALFRNAGYGGRCL